MKYFITGIFTVTILLFFPTAHRAHAATMFLSNDGGIAHINDGMLVTVRIDSEESGFNAAQGTITFPKNILEVVSIDTAHSIFTFWLEEPSFSNEKGEIRFIGGGTSGLTGKALSVITIFFKVKGVGDASIALTDGAVTASDGSGTNILSEMKGVKISAAAKEISKIATDAPKQITRAAAPAKKTPLKPDLSIPIYPLQEKWYNATTPFFVTWQLPDDVTDVATALNNNPSFLPNKSEGLFDSKTFPSLDDGVSYVHIRFKNAIGWGPATHYRIAIDTVAPRPFTIEALDGISTDNPAPTIQFESADAASGIDHYEIRTGTGGLIITTTNSQKLPLLAPGGHIIRVRAVDGAGNGNEQTIDIQTIPIASPRITAINEKLFRSAGTLEMQGSALPKTKIEYSFKRTDGSKIHTGEAPVDENGNWLIKINQAFVQGDYFAELRTKDERGAQSLHIQSKPLHSAVGERNTFLTVVLASITVIILFICIAAILLLLPRSIIEKSAILAQLKTKIASILNRLKGDNLRYYSGGIAKLKKGFDYVQDHVVITDPRGTIVYANKAIEKATGFSAKEIIGKNPGDLWGSNMPEAFYKKMWHTIKVEKKQFVGKAKNKRKDGSWYWQEIRISPVLDKRGNIKYFIGIQPLTKA